jgi:hypothetical protein
MRYLSSLALLCLLAMTAGAADDAGFKPLFNGTDLTGWKQIGGKEGIWGVEKGMLVTRSGGGGWLSTEKTYADFILRLEYRMAPGGNSGVFLRTPREGNPWIVGMEIQLLDDPHPKYKTIKPWQHTGSIYGVVPPKKSALKPAGEWNRVEVRAKGPNITVILNGETVVRLISPSTRMPRRSIRASLARTATSACKATMNAWSFGKSRSRS